MDALRGGIPRLASRRDSSARKSMISAANATSRSDSASGLACSSVSTRAMPADRSRKSLVAPAITPQRSSGVSALQEGKLRAAAWAGASISAGPALGNSPRTAAEAGLTTARLPAAVCAIDSPSMLRGSEEYAMAAKSCGQFVSLSTSTDLLTMKQVCCKTRRETLNPGMHHDYNAPLALLDFGRRGGGPCRRRGHAPDGVGRAGSNRGDRPEARAEPANR